MLGFSFGAAECGFECCGWRSAFGAGEVAESVWVEGMLASAGGVVLETHFVGCLDDGVCAMNYEELDALEVGTEKDVGEVGSRYL